MIRLLVQDGGRELLWDDFQQLEAVTNATTQALCAATGQTAFIISGCRLSATGGTVRLSSGVVYLNGQLLRVVATSDLTLPIEIVVDSTPVLTNDRRYEDGSTHPGASEVFAIARNATSTITAKIEITDLSGGYTYAQAMADAARPIGQIEWMGLYLSAQYDSSGRGIGKARGWAICNGANGTINLGGRFPTSISGQLGGDYVFVGQTGGAEKVVLTTAQLPPHSHQISQGDSYLGGGGPGTVGRGGPNPNGFRTAVEGAAEEHENRPPFTVLLARQWIGF